MIRTGTLYNEVTIVMEDDNQGRPLRKQNRSLRRRWQRLLAKLGGFPEPRPPRHYLARIEQEEFPGDSPDEAIGYAIREGLDMVGLLEKPVLLKIIYKHK